MKSTKIKVAFAEDIEEHRKRIAAAISETESFEVSIKATSGRDLILQLIRNPKKQPTLILMDMQMPNCDGLLATIICKWLFPFIKIVGFSAHTDGIVVGEFSAEGGDAFLSKLIINKALASRVYSDENIFENALKQIATTNNGFVDKMLEDTGENFKNRQSTTQLIFKNCKYLNDIEIKYLQLNAAGFERKEIAEILNIGEATIKAIISKVYKILKAETHTDIISSAINLGIAKFVRIYQPNKTLVFD
jgi:DNA-binding NarL/FixJ family response regulator